ncbi:esterase family protein [Pseudidiomarina marina]|uniref:alpha/beta hydrolase n=1 Tax=Pseudidiomarina marina TaxID=502366 RepID=UPI00384BB90D
MTCLLAACSSTPPKNSAITQDSEQVHKISPIEYLPALAGDYFKLQSTAVGRPYHIFVRLPEGYDANTKQYPVVYLLDGDSLFPLLSPTHLFLTYDENLPEAIIVGIAYGGFGDINKRDIDFTAPAADGKLEIDGAPKFLKFLKTELIPRIEHSYRADSDRRILFGQSRGGYFTLWSALADPDLFYARIASNPTITPGQTRFFEAPSLAPNSQGLVAVATGTRDRETRMVFANRWTSYWNEQPNPPWQSKHFIIENGTHAATVGETYRQTMIWIFNEQ